jgi:hypothetical protein
MVAELSRMMARSLAARRRAHLKAAEIELKKRRSLVTAGPTHSRTVR